MAKRIKFFPRHLSILLIVVLILTLSLFPTALIAGLDFNADTSIYLANTGITLTVSSGASVDSMTVKGGSIDLTTCAACTIIFTSTDKYTLTNTCGVDTSCGASSSSITITTSSSTSCTITPSTDTCSGGGGGPGGGGGGGSGTPTIPSNTSIIINDDAAETATREVTLTLAATNATLMMVSNNSDFSDITQWENYTTSKSWTLTEGEGEKIVYAKFRSSSGGESTKISDSIVYNLAATPEAQEPPTTPTPPSGVLAAGGITKTADSSTVYYYGNDNKRYIFFNAKVYKSWYGEDFSGLYTATRDEYSDLPLGGLVTYRPGTRMVKIQTDPKVYAVAKGGVLRWVKTEAIAEELYGEDWNQQIDDVPETLFFAFTVGTNIEKASDYDKEAEMQASQTINEDKGL